mgnify:CR=1 FL=1
MHDKLEQMLKTLTLWLLAINSPESQCSFPQMFTRIYKHKPMFYPTHPESLPFWFVFPRSEPLHLEKLKQVLNQGHTGVSTI